MWAEGGTGNYQGIVKVSLRSPSGQDHCKPRRFRPNESSRPQELRSVFLPSLASQWSATCSVVDFVSPIR